VRSPHDPGRSRRVGFPRCRECARIGCATRTRAVSPASEPEAESEPEPASEAESEPASRPGEPASEPELASLAAGAGVASADRPASLVGATETGLLSSPLQATIMGEVSATAVSERRALSEEAAGPVSNTSSTSGAWLLAVLRRVICGVDWPRERSCARARCRFSSCEQQWSSATVASAGRLCATSRRGCRPCCCHAGCRPGRSRLGSTMSSVASRLRSLCQSPTPAFTSSRGRKCSARRTSLDARRAASARGYLDRR
jgi:hypothetical protein